MPVLHRIIIERDNIKRILVHFMEVELVHNVEILKALIEVLSLIQAADVVDAGIEDRFVTDEDLQTSSKLAVLFQYKDLVSFFAQDVCALQSTQSAADNYHIILCHELPLLQCKL